MGRGFELHTKGRVVVREGDERFKLKVHRVTGCGRCQLSFFTEQIVVSNGRLGISFKSEHIVHVAKRDNVRRVFEEGPIG